MLSKLKILKLKYDIINFQYIYLNFFFYKKKVRLLIPKVTELCRILQTSTPTFFCFCILVHKLAKVFHH